MTPDYEKLGAFYLGRLHDLEAKKTTPELLLYDARDLTTHAVCIGMTGSGKTGLCISLLEEAAMDDIPAVIVDPKGDMTNLLLTFPQLRPEDFRPWISAAEADRHNLSVDEYAARQAALWTKGLAQWDQDGGRIQRMRERTEFAVYTPGSRSGRPLSILSSFTAPDAAVLEMPDALAERISTTASSLLGLLGIEADPIKSREHILLSTLFDFHWRRGQDLDLPELIRAVQDPPVDKVGVFDLATFYPAKERFELAMSLNNLLASPSFSAWLEGDALDIGQLLYTPAGRPRMAICTIAHLSDAERMFFTALLLNQLLGWMRSQSGTSSLRALLYIDELFGFMPPVGEPPSKKPLLTLMKQARAFGLGVVLATQNPVDLDYKGLSNAGTWFIGRLQTERDRERVLDGVLAGAGREQRAELIRTLGGLGKRVFLLHNVHENEPAVFHTRWAMSYLAGPLTRAQIGRLAEAAAGEAPSGAAPGVPSGAPAGDLDSGPPALDPAVTQVYLPLRGPAPAASGTQIRSGSAGGRGAGVIYRPRLWGSGRVRFHDKRAGVDHEIDVACLAALESGAVTVDWDGAQAVDFDAAELAPSGEPGARYDNVPAAARNPSSYKKWQREFHDLLYHNQKLVLFEHEQLKEVSRPGESERDFRIRLAQTARERRDDWTEQVRDKYAKKREALEKKIDRAEAILGREQDQARQHKIQTAISIGTTLLGAFLGRKALSRTTVSRAGTVARRASRGAKEAGDVTRAEEALAGHRADLEELEAAFERDLQERTGVPDPAIDPLESRVIRPLKSRITVELVALAWEPHWRLPGGNADRA